MIINSVKFQKILHCAISHIIGKSLFQWCDTKRSWEIFFSLEMTENSDKLHSRGIFLLPHELRRKPWNKIAEAGNRGDISRTIECILVDYLAYRRLLERDWLNDEILNAYNSLMVQQADTIALSTYLWQAMLNGNSSGIKLMV